MRRPYFQLGPVDVFCFKNESHGVGIICFAKNGSVQNSVLFH